MKSDMNEVINGNFYTVDKESGGMALKNCLIKDENGEEYEREKEIFNGYNIVHCVIRNVTDLQVKK